MHAYGTNGAITAAERAAARAQPWTDVTAAFASVDDAAAFALDVARAPALVARAATVFEAPLAHRFLGADKLLHGARSSGPRRSRTHARATSRSCSARRPASTRSRDSRRTVAVP